jgi:hypothetical protein
MKCWSLNSWSEAPIASSEIGKTLVKWLESRDGTLTRGLDAQYAHSKPTNKRGSPSIDAIETCSSTAIAVVIATDRSKAWFWGDTIDNSSGVRWSKNNDPDIHCCTMCIVMSISDFWLREKLEKFCTQEISRFLISKGQKKKLEKWKSRDKLHNFFLWS